MALLLRRHFEHAAARCADGGDECAQAGDARDEAADARAGEHGPGVVDAFGKGVVVTFEGLFDDIDDDVEVDKEEEGGNRGAGWEGRGAGSEGGAGWEGLVLVSVALFFWYDIVGSVVEARGRPAESMVQRQRLCVGWRRAWSA